MSDKLIKDVKDVKPLDLMNPVKVLRRLDLNKNDVPDMVELREKIEEAEAKITPFAANVLPIAQVVLPELNEVIHELAEQSPKLAALLAKYDGQLSELSKAFEQFVEGAQALPGLLHAASHAVAGLEQIK